MAAPASSSLPSTVVSSFASTSRAASEFKIDSLHWFGVDLDHTLVRYRLKPFFEMVYTCLVNYTLQIKGDIYGRYSEYMTLPFDHDFCSKGLVFEFSTGNLLRLDSGGCILRASHGTRQLSLEEILSVYGTSRLFAHFADAATFTRNINFEYFTTYFDMPAALMCARLVDAFDALGAPANSEPESLKYDFRTLIRGAFTHNFDFDAFATNRGWYFPELKAHTSRYIYKRGAVRRWLEHLRKDCKVRVFLLTNSHADYSECLLNYSFGSDWKDVFDLVICRGLKPGFFCAEAASSASHFYHLDKSTMREGEKIKDAGKTLQLGDYVVQGNVKDLIEFFERNKATDPLYEGTGKTVSKLEVAYSGDHIHGDVVAVNLHTDWWTVAVLEEMWDDYHHDFTHSIPASHVNDAYHKLASLTTTIAATTTVSDSSGAFSSSNSIVASYNAEITQSSLASTTSSFLSCCNTDDNEAKENNESHLPTCNVLASKRWGSFFAHSHEHECDVPENRPTKRPRTGPEQEPVLTHLTHLIINHSTIVVPCLSSLCNFEEKHENHESCVERQPLALPGALAGLSHQHG